MGMGGVVAACFCGARVPFIEEDRGEGWVVEGSSTPLMADSVRGRAGRSALQHHQPPYSKAVTVLLEMSNCGGDARRCGRGCHRKKKRRRRCV